MKKLLRLVFAATFLVTANFIIAQNNNVGIGTTTPKESAKLDIESTTQGLLPPRMTEAQRDAMPVLPATTLEAGLVIWCTDCGTNGEMQVYNGTAWTNMVGGPAAAAQLAIGDSYGGGIVAYILQPSDPGYDANEQRGLIASTADLNSGTGIQWTTPSFWSTTVPLGATSTTNGYANTIAIVAQAGAGSTYAAGLCHAYSAPGDGGLNDWYLPSKDELNKLYLNRIAIGGFANDSYWSSTEAGNVLAWYQGFLNGNQPNNGKDATYKVRAVRAFPRKIVQERLASGETPLSIYTGLLSEGSSSSDALDSLYGKTYQGGLIFHLDITDGTGLIAATADLNSGTKIQWTTFSYHNTAVPGGSSFTGVSNTNNIVAQTGAPAANTYAAGLCRLYSAPGDGGLNDWYLPAINELDLMWKNLADSDGNNDNTGPSDPNNLGGFAFDGYWSSSEQNSVNARFQAFSNGSQVGTGKGAAWRVRAVRSF